MAPPDVEQVIQGTNHKGWRRQAHRLHTATHTLLFPGGLLPPPLLGIANGGTTVWYVTPSIGGQRRTRSRMSVHEKAAFVGHQGQTAPPVSGRPRRPHPASVCFQEERQSATMQMKL